ncbi:putative lipid II flippase FtsW [bacterium]|nr:putative lipid II flippase FtsW [bacterium]
MEGQRTVDKFFLTLVVLLVSGGFFIFSSASLGLLARGSIAVGGLVFNQFFLGIVLGGFFLFLFSRIHYTMWRKYAFYLFLGGIILTAGVFIPSLGFEHGGATRWIHIGTFSFQPAEFLKFGAAAYAAAWFSWVKAKGETVRHGLVPIAAMIGIVGVLLIMQPDTGTFIVMASMFLGVYLANGCKWRHFLVLIGALCAGLLVLLFMKPYLMDRMMTFINPEDDPLGSSYQIQQSLIAVGSGAFTGRGFGQSIQKFNFLPEPIGDSIFAVAAEEFGFIGTSFIIAVFVLFAYRGFYIARHAPDRFSRLFVSGIVILIVLQSFINMASMLGVFPLTGVPLLFISHGGTAMMMALAEVGVILGVSRYMRAA